MARGVIAMPAVLAMSLAGAVWAGTFYVSPKGADTNAGTEQAPFATPQRAVSAAQAGDRILVRAGVYQGQVAFPRSGKKDAPIVLEGQEGAVLDAGFAVTGWEPAPEIAPGVYKKKVVVPAWPASVQQHGPVNLWWDNRLVLRVRGENMKKGAGIERMKEPAGSEKWQGVEALFGMAEDGLTYLRHGQCLDPNKAAITVSAHWELDEGAAVLAKDKSHLVIRGFVIRNASVGVCLRDGASDNIIENNTIYGGKYGVFVGYQPWGVSKSAGVEVLCHRNHIRNNQITLGFIADIKLPHPRHLWVWDQFKDFSDNDREGVALFSAGHDNHVYGNHIFSHWGGIQDWAALEAWRDRYAVPLPNKEFCQRLKVYGNVVHDILDDGLEPTGGEIDAEWRHNTVYNCNVNLRIKFPAGGPCYIYGNRFSNPQPVRAEHCDIFHFRDTKDARVYVYHNSFASHRGNKLGSKLRGSEENAERSDSWYVNNIFSNHDFGSRPYGGMPPGAHFGYNLVASEAKCELKGEGNVLILGKRLWDAAAPSFELEENSPAIGKGLDLSKEWTLDGVKHPPLPGMAPAYFSGAAPDLGSAQRGRKWAP